MTDLNADALGEAAKAYSAWEGTRNDPPRTYDIDAAAYIVAAYLAALPVPGLAAGAETERSIAIAQIVAKSWADWAMRQGEFQYPGRMTAHPLGCVRAALDGERDPAQLGIGEGTEAWDAILSAAAPISEGGAG